MAIRESVEALTLRLTLDNPELHDAAIRTYKCIQIANQILFDAKINNFNGADVVAVAHLIQEGASK
jgi:hypothetical protein